MKISFFSQLKPWKNKIKNECTVKNDDLVAASVHILLLMSIIKNGLMSINVKKTPREEMRKDEKKIQFTKTENDTIP